MDREINLLALDDLPLDLGPLGMVTEADLIMPGVYNAILEQQETGVEIEAFVVSKSTPEISKTAKDFGKPAPGNPELLVYFEDAAGNTRYIIGYEVLRYKILHQLPLLHNDDIRSIAAIGAEMYPGYFGICPVPYLTPWGYTTRSKIIANGVFWLETEQCQRGLAVAFPKSDDLSDGARVLSERFDDGSAHINGQIPGYLFFREADSSVPLFELLCLGPNEELSCSINLAALMNAVYQFHPEYAAQHNVAEQIGKNNGFGQFLRTLGIDFESQRPPERLITLAAQAGTEFIVF